MRNHDVKKRGQKEMNDKENNDNKKKGRKEEATE